MDNFTPSTKSYPMAIIFATLSFLVILLNIPPLLWHITKRNHAFLALISWVLLLNIFSFVNAIIWPSQASLSPANYSGAGLCDIEAKLIIGSYSALPSTLLVILRGLAHVLDTKRMNLSPTSTQSRRKNAIEALVIWTAPILMMAGHYIVQSNRYYLFTISGCNPSAYPSIPSLLLIFLPPLIVALGAGYYAVLLLVRILRYRRDFGSMLNRAGSNKSRFLRPVILSIVSILIIIPLSVFMLVQNLRPGLLPYSWTAVHEDWDAQRVDTGGAVLPDRWVRIAAGILIFVFFGWGSDARAMYSTWLKRMGVTTAWSHFKMPRRAGSTTSSEMPIVSTASSGRKSWFKMRKYSNSTMSDLPTATTDCAFAKGASKGGRRSLGSSFHEPISPRSAVSSATTFASSILDRLSKIRTSMVYPSGVLRHDHEEDDMIDVEYGVSKR